MKPIRILRGRWRFSVAIPNFKIQYAALTGLLDSLIFSIETVVSKRYVDDYDSIFAFLRNHLGNEVNHLCPSKLKIDDYGWESTQDLKVSKFELISKIKQLKSILEIAYNVTDRSVQIGSLYNSINDSELRSRCSDLLSANDHFDRVLNQATQVLEDRIRNKSGVTDKIGADLVNATMKVNVEETILKLSERPNEHEGYIHICRGIMMAVRNTSHHHFTYTTKEDAFAFCGFVDQLLRLIDQAEVKKL